MRINSGAPWALTLFPIVWEAAMTTIESYYLALCIAAMCLFALSLGYNATSWKSWKDSRTTAKDAGGTDGHVKPQTKLAA